MNIVTERRMKYWLHIPIVSIIIVFHYFSADIFAYFYLNNIERKFINITTSNGKLYSDGEYTPLLKKNPYLKIPRGYKFVFVEKDENVTREIYYTKGGEKVEALYFCDRIQQISGESIPNNAFFVIPIFGFLISLFSILHDMLRTGNIFSWRIGRSPDAIEKIAYLYGLSFCGFGIIVVIIRQLWLK